MALSIRPATSADLPLMRHFAEPAWNRLPGSVRYGFMPSTVIQSFSYDHASAALDVTFLSGRRYRYFLVPGYIARGLAEAFSKGRYFNARIRDNYPFEELPTEEDTAAALTSRGKGSRQRP